MLRPLEEPMRTRNSRRGGGGVDEAGGTLASPWPGCATLGMTSAIEED
jgi:hypothetical protein